MTAKSDRIGRLEALLAKIRQRSAEPRAPGAVLWAEAAEDASAYEEAPAWQDASESGEHASITNGVAVGEVVAHWATEDTETHVASYPGEPPVSAEMEPLPLSSETSSRPGPPMSEPLHEGPDSFHSGMLDEYEMSDDVVEINVDAEDDSVRTSVHSPAFELPPVQGLPPVVDPEATLDAASAAAALDAGTTTAVHPVASIDAIAAERALGAERGLDADGTLEFEQPPAVTETGDQRASDSLPGAAGWDQADVTAERTSPTESVRTIVSVRPFEAEQPPEAAQTVETAPSVSGSRLAGDEALAGEGEEMIVGEADLVPDDRGDRAEDVAVDVDEMVEAALPPEITIEPPASSRRPITLSPTPDIQPPLMTEEAEDVGALRAAQEMREEEEPPFTPPPMSGRQIAAEYDFEPAPPTLHPLTSSLGSDDSQPSVVAKSGPHAPLAPHAVEEPDEATELDAPRQIWKATSPPPQVEPETFGMWLDDTLSL